MKAARVLAFFFAVGFFVTSDAAAAEAVATGDEAAPEATEPRMAVPPRSHRVTWYAQALARGAAGLNVTYFWSKGHMMRAETVVSGHKIVTIVRGDRYYAYDEVNRSGVSIRRTPEAIALDAPNRRPFGNELLILEEQGAEKVSEEDVMGRPCDVFRVTDSRGRRDLWVTRDELRIPLRVEVYDRSRSTKLYTDYVNWQSGLAISDDFFVPDPTIDFDVFEFEEYFRHATTKGPAGPVPILYADLLRGFK